jgi:hypothetical protein
MTDLLKKTGALLWVPFAIALAVIWQLVSSLGGQKQKLAEKDAEISLAKTMAKVGDAERESKNAESSYRDTVARYRADKGTSKD